MNELSLELYRTLFFCRRSEELIIKYYPENEMRTPMHMSMGQEAIAVGVCAALGPEAQILTSYRSHASFLAKTRDSDIFFGELFGKISGTAAGKGGSMHLVHQEKGFLGSSGIVGSGIPVALGAAFANRRLKKERNVGVFFGDGALDEGVFWESLNVACLMKIPVLFVCEDNGLAVHTSTKKRRGFLSPGSIIREFNCIVIERDTTDVEQIYNVTSEVVERMKREDRPAFLSLKCYRYLEHVGVGTDFDDGYRSKSEFDEWSHRDPVLLQRRRLAELGFLDSDILQEEIRVEKAIESSIQKARASDSPAANRLYRGVFHEDN